MSAYMSLIDSLKAFLMIDTRYFTLEIFIVPVNPMQLVRGVIVRKLVLVYLQPCDLIE